MQILMGIMKSDYDDLLEEFNIKIVKHLDGMEKTDFMQHVFEHYEFSMESSSHPLVIKYYKDVFTKLVKDYGH
tara:strand:- start:41 stop:259 length:219 start_codon:yes stop_codon:yes gene_type:complete